MNSIGVRLSLLITGGTGFVGQSLIKQLGCQNIYLASRRDTVAWHKALVEITHVVQLATRAQVMLITRGARWLRIAQSTSKEP